MSKKIKDDRNNPDGWAGEYYQQVTRIADLYLEANNHEDKVALIEYNDAVIRLRDFIAELILDKANELINKKK